MTDNVAVLDGYTEEYLAQNIARDLYLLVKPGTDLKGEIIRAWDMDRQEYITIRGPEWVFTPIPSSPTGRIMKNWTPPYHEFPIDKEKS